MAGLVVVLVGPSAAGKTSLARAAAKHIKGMSEPISHATRMMRPGENEGQPYHFITPEWFDNKQRHGDFVEVVEYAGEKYGYDRRVMEAALAKGDTVVVTCRDGAEQFERAYPNRVLKLFVMPPIKTVLAMRMEARGNSPEEITQRLALVDEEVKYADRCEGRIHPDTEEHMLGQLQCAILAYKDKLSKVAS
jgi:guanylate kinase